MHVLRNNLIQVHKNNDKLKEQHESYKNQLRHYLTPDIFYSQRKSHRRYDIKDLDRTHKNADAISPCCLGIQE